LILQLFSKFRRCVCEIQNLNFKISKCVCKFINILTL